MCKRILDSNFNLAVIDKISNFQEIAPNFTYLQKSHFLKYNNFWNILDQHCFFNINFMAEKCKECTFSFLPVVYILSFFEREQTEIRLWNCNRQSQNTGTWFWTNVKYHLQQGALTNEPGRLFMDV